MRWVGVLWVGLMLASGARAAKPGCLELAAAGDMAPPALYQAMDACLAEAKYDRAADLYALAGAESAYDTARVSGAGAREAHTALTKGKLAALETAARSALMVALKSKLADPAELPKTCAAIAKLGPPRYDPSYLLGAPSSVPPEFEPAAAWRSALAAYLHCP